MLIYIVVYNNIYIYINIGSIHMAFIEFLRGRPLNPPDWRFVGWKEPWGKVLGALPKDFFGSKIWAWEGIEPAEVDKCPRNSSCANH